VDAAALDDEPEDELDAEPADAAFDAEPARAAVGGVASAEVAPDGTPPVPATADVEPVRDTPASDEGALEQAASARQVPTTSSAIGARGTVMRSG
jgi:hypothetical protein